ncbi:hypothetical protein [Taibaiella lutea]|nr:hypothetical protein [Taibaiella lutea]
MLSYCQQATMIGATFEITTLPDPGSVGYLDKENDRVTKVGEQS